MTSGFGFDAGGQGPSKRAKRRATGHATRLCASKGTGIGFDGQNATDAPQTAQKEPDVDLKLAPGSEKWGFHQEGNYIGWIIGKGATSGSIGLTLNPDNVEPTVWLPAYCAGCLLQMYLWGPGSEQAELWLKQAAKFEPQSDSPKKHELTDRT